MFNGIKEFYINIFGLTYRVILYLFIFFHLLLVMTSQLAKVCVSLFWATLYSVSINQNIYFEGLYLASSTMASAMGNTVPAVTFLIASILGYQLSFQLNIDYKNVYFHQ